MAELHHESVVPNLRNGVRFYFSDEPLPKYVPFHWHNSIELVYVIDGHLRFTIDGSSLDVDDGEFAMVRSGAIHDVASGPNHAYVLQVPLRVVRPFVDEPEKVAFVNGESGSRDYARIASSVYALGDILRHPGEGSAFDFEIYLLTILKRMFTAFKAPGEAPGPADGVKEIIAYLHEHVTESIVVGELAERFGYNPSYLSRMFKQKTGISLVGYIYELKVNRLNDDLLQTNLPIAELMERNGLTNPRLTREVFQRQFGMLPKDVRKRAREGAAGA